MINFRFHVVSLIAIFLALALGVVIGAGVIDRGVVDTLNTRLDKVESDSGRIKSQNDVLNDRNQQLSNVVGDLQPFSVSSRLVGDEVGIVAVRGVDGDRVSAVVTAAQQADATVTGTLWLESKWSLSSDDDVQALQNALGSTTKNKNALRDEGYQQLARRLGAPEAAGDQDLLAALQKAGFVGFDSVGQSTITAFPGRDAGVVLAIGNKGSVAPNLVAVPLAGALHTSEVAVVVAGVWAEVTDGPARNDAVQPIRDGELARTVSTIDDLDLVEGPATTVLALSDLFLTPPVVGHYGYGPNTQPLPDPVGR